jgi:four helix bundle protein
MATIKCFEEVEAWKSGYQLNLRVYDLTKRPEFSKDFPLRDQVRRAAISIISNIAEGFESQTDKTFSRFLGIAKASAGELRAQFYIALAQDYVTKDEFTEVCSLCRSVARKCSKFMNYLENGQST